MPHMIPIGTLIPAADAVRIIPQAAKLGFECFAVQYWLTTGDTNVMEEAKRIREVAESNGTFISAIGMFGNPLWSEGQFADTRASFERVIEAAPTMGAPIVAGFTGRLPEGSIPDSIPRFKEVWGDLAKRAADKGLKIAWENCDMGDTWRKGQWNMATTPDAWELLFDALPVDNIGLEWEPCHQMCHLIDPIPQLRKWAPKIFHLHGKDATIAWDIIREHGIDGPVQAVHHRTPGFGDSNWADIITILRQHNYQGTIDIEGYHDPVYRGELEWTGQVRGLQYLKDCRGGDYVPNL